MTARIDSAGRPAVAVTGALASARRVRPLGCVAAVARMVLLTTLRNPPVIVMGVVQSVVFLLIFRYVFGGAIGVGAMPYVDFMVPGILTVGVLFSVMGVGPTVAEDLRRGVVDRFRSLPMPAAAVPIGRALGSHALTTFTLLVTTALAFAVGFRAREGLSGTLAMLGLCLLTAVAFTWVFVVAGLAVGDPQAAQGLGFLVLPLSFVSSAFVPVESMPGWLRVFAQHQPLTVIAEANRYLTQGAAWSSGAGQSGAWYVTAAVLWCLGILGISVPLALVLFRRR
ncbi:ABC transporter permease [Nocardia otitidiscaviarum]|uniref:ABC transporter permease n=1 Tax=Nocardia otitidiscaviarum TaxID=1823 RepID=UPI0018954C79|nr:ABC transporter permease [Nocardia otitidiscaviarum]MBF6237010.1 ABC transporter permease [Nocardia otitidiscaviarum]